MHRTLGVGQLADPSVEEMVDHKAPPLYHHGNAVVFPQDPDTALTAIGMTPQNLAKVLLVQFVGEDRQVLRHHSDLSV